MRHREADITFPVGTTKVALLDVDGTMLIGDGVINQTIIDHLKENQISDVLLFTNMGDTTRLGRRDQPTREYLIRKLEKQGVRVHAVITPYDHVFLGPGSVYREFFAPLILKYERLSDDEKSGDAWRAALKEVDDIVLRNFRAREFKKFLFQNLPPSENKKLSELIAQHCRHLFVMIESNIGVLFFHNDDDFAQRLPGKLKGNKKLGELIQSSYVKAKNWHYIAQKGYMAETVLKLFSEKGISDVFYYDDDKTYLTNVSDVLNNMAIKAFSVNSKTGEIASHKLCRPYPNFAYADRPADVVLSVNDGPSGECSPLMRAV